MDFDSVSDKVRNRYQKQKYKVYAMVALGGLFFLFLAYKVLL